MVLWVLDHSIEPVELLMMIWTAVLHFVAGKDQDSKYFVADSSFGCIGDQVSFQEKQPMDIQIFGWLLHMDMIDCQ